MATYGVLPSGVVEIFSVLALSKTSRNYELLDISGRDRTYLSYPVTDDRCRSLRGCLRQTWSVSHHDLRWPVAKTVRAFSYFLVRRNASVRHAYTDGAVVLAIVHVADHSRPLLHQQCSFESSFRDLRIHQLGHLQLQIYCKTSAFVTRTKMSASMRNWYT